MATATTGIRIATTAEIPALSATLAEAFQSDPVMTWCYPDDDHRARILPDAFSVMLRHTIPHGGVGTVDGEMTGSIWLPPTAEVDEEAMIGELVEISGEYAERVVTAFELLDEHHPTEEQHQYLFILGTRDAWRSKGLGSALIRSVTVGCDRDGLGAYLEATSERNRSLYERHGFEVTEVLHLPDGPPLWCMWRNPGGV